MQKPTKVEAVALVVVVLVLGVIFHNVTYPDDWYRDRYGKKGPKEVVNKGRMYRCKKAECAPNQYPICEWNGGPYAQQAVKPSPLSVYIKFLNSLSVSYYVSGRTALGAFRNGGQSAGDHEIDILFPMWYNLESEAKHCQQTYGTMKPRLEGDPNNPKLCQKTREEWVDSTLTLFKERNSLFNLEFKKHPEKSGFIRMTGSVGSADVEISLSEEMLIRSTVNGTAGLCRCDFSGVETLALKDTKTLLLNKYGQDFMQHKEKKEKHKGHNDED